MFPHNSSSHEISTETNAFVQNSKGDVVVLEGSSLSGVGEGNGPEDAGYCDIEFINSSSSSSRRSTMAAPTNHPEATAANDFSTVLSRHSGELGSVGVHLTWRSHLPPATAATALLTSSSSTPPSSSPSSAVAAAADAAVTSSHDNNNKANNNNNIIIIINNNNKSEEVEVGGFTTSNHNNAEHNHHKCRKQSNTSRCWPEACRRRTRHPRLIASLAANSKSTSKPLSDNKDSFSSVSPRVLSLRFRHKKKKKNSSSSSSKSGDIIVSNMKDKMMMMMMLIKKKKYNRLLTGPTPSLVRIPKSDGQRALNLKAKHSCISYFKRNNSMSVISLSSSSNNNHHQYHHHHNHNSNKNNINNVIVEEEVMIKVRRSDGPSLARTASSSITLIVSKRREPQPPGAGAVPRRCPKVNRLIIGSGVVAIELPRLLISALCVPLMIGTPWTIATIIEKKMKMRRRERTTTTTRLAATSSRRIIDGISCTEATICTVGALSFQDNNKSNEPLNTSFKSIAPAGEKEEKEEEMGGVVSPGRESNLTLKSLSKSTPSVKSSDKSDTDVVVMINNNNKNNDNDNAFRGASLEYNNSGHRRCSVISEQVDGYEKKMKKIKGDEEGEKEEEEQGIIIISQDDDVGQRQERPTVNIPTVLTTCEPTMALNCQSTIVTSQTNDVPAEPRFDDDHLSVHHEDEKNKTSINAKMTTITTMRENKTRTSLVKTCKDLLANYRTTRDPCRLTRLREALNTLLKIRDYSYAPKSIKPTTTTSITAPSFYTSSPPSTCTGVAAATNIFDYKQRWGIASFLGLAGGGESSLNNSAAANWASAQTTTPNNNNQAQSGWGGGGGGTPGNQPVVGAQAGPPSNWQSVPGPRTIGSQIANQNPNQNQNQGPTGPPTNQGSNAQAGPPTSQTSNQAQANQGSGGGAGSGNQWPQSGGKTANPVIGGSNNPQGQNNNSGNVPPQQQQQQPSQQQAQQQQAQAQQQQPVVAAGNNNQQLANPGPGAVSAATTPTTNNPSTKHQLEQLNTMREALFSPDGWGCQHVNQDTNWDVPTSPEPNMNKDGVPMWKPPVNNGTDLWEANLRNGGQPPPQQQAKTPWGHTPSTNIGGTWGEDDDTADSSNMWTGAPAPSQPNSAQWPGSSGNQTGMWSAPTGAGGGGGATGGGAFELNHKSTAGSSWGDPRVDPRDPREIRSVDPREMRGGDPRDHRMSLDPREQHIRVIDPMARDPRMSGEMRGDPRGGISGRLNGASADAMWNQPPGPPHHQIPGHQHPSGPPTKMLAPSSINQWSAPQPKDMMPSKPSGWEEPSPPTQRRNMPNYDDGTSLWANPASNQRAMQSSKVTHWKDVPSQNLGRGGMQCPPGMLQNQMPGQPGMKPDSVGGGGGGGGGGGPMWATHPGGGGPTGGGHNGSWTDGPPEATGWGETKSRNRRYPTMSDIVDPRTGKTLWDEHQKPQPMGPSGVGNWADSDMDPTSSWGHTPKPALTKELIWNSREFRYLCDMGFKKEDVEAALRSREMNREEAQELLNQLRPVDQWRRHDGGHSGYDPGNQSAGAQSFPRFNHVTQQMSFPPGVGVPSGAVSAAGGSVSSASLLKLQQQQQQQQQAAAVQLQQQQQPSSNAPQPPFNQTSRTPQNQPSTQQLRMLVQQIQLAVQEGYLNHQILNQPLAPQTLMFLNQLLQQIKVLQQLHQQHTMQNSLKANGQNVLQISVQITKTKQQITNLQNQIAVQQATYMKQQQQQQQQQQHPTTPSQPSDYYKPSVHDPMSALQNSFSDLTMNKEPPVSQQQSRLNQWKLPSLDKDGDSIGNEFSRAPGSSSVKPPTTPGGLSQLHSSPNMNPLLGPGDGTWSTRLGDSGWPDAGNNDSTDGKDWQPQSAGAAFTDLVPEFEPGKPWKGTQMKTIEDDPSITPGSVVRSPLSLAAIKDPDTLFSTSSKTSPPPQSVNADSTSIPSLSNSTWSFNPPASTPSIFTRELRDLNSAKNTWGEAAPPPTAVTSELWGAPMSKSRGPPPGLSSKSTSSVSNATNGWAALSRSNTWGLQSNAPGAGNTGWVSPSTWLLLRNLTPQIDGSTLKTLCMQHGPVQDFRLYLNHGIALAKYSSKDEAIKAQGALNNCVLGNTTIFAESPGDSEVHTLLQQLSHGSRGTAGGGGGGGGTGATGANPEPPKLAADRGWVNRPPLVDAQCWGTSTSQLWSAPPTSNSLWSSTGIDTSDQQRATPSSLNSYLPGDLLGGESM